MSQITTDLPQHEHDCTSCVFLGGHGVYDLYFHEGRNPVFTTVIARFGSDGDYMSGLPFSVGDHPLAEAKRRAIAAGFAEAIVRATKGQS